MGEFGRTSKNNRQQGRDDFPDTRSTVLCRGRIKTGTLHGKTPTALQKDRPVRVPDLLATVAKALGIDSTTQNFHLWPAHSDRGCRRLAYRGRAGVTSGRLLDLNRLPHPMTLLRFSDLIGKFLNRPKVGGSRAVWVVPALLPVLQGLERDSVSARKYRLAHAKSFPDRTTRVRVRDR
jgi:Protein of unknown function (DUF1501)